MASLCSMRSERLRWWSNRHTWACTIPEALPVTFLLLRRWLEGPASPGNLQQVSVLSGKTSSRAGGPSGSLGRSWQPFLTWPQNHAVTLAKSHWLWAVKRPDITLSTNVCRVKAMIFFQWSCTDVRIGPPKRLSTKELMLLNCGSEEALWDSLGQQGDQTSQS